MGDYPQTGHYSIAIQIKWSNGCKSIIESILLSRVHDLRNYMNNNRIYGTRYIAALLENVGVWYIIIT